MLPTSWPAKYGKGRRKAASNQRIKLDLLPCVRRLRDMRV